MRAPVLQAIHIQVPVGIPLPDGGLEIPNRIFLGGIPAETTEQELEIFFSEFGVVNDVRIVTDRKTGACKGYGFVTFDKEEDIMKLLEKKSITMKGKRLRVRKAVRRNGSQFDNLSSDDESVGPLSPSSSSSSCSSMDSFDGSSTALVSQPSPGVSYVPSESVAVPQTNPFTSGNGLDGKCSPMSPTKGYSQMMTPEWYGSGAEKYFLVPLDSVAVPRTQPCACNCTMPMQYAAFNPSMPSCQPKVCYVSGGAFSYNYAPLQF